MPELPEVETVVKQLQKKILNKTIQKVDIIDSKVIDQKVAELAPFTINNVTRRGKSIILHLDNGYFLLTHLRMTGHFHHVTRNSTDLTHKKYLCGVFHLNDSILTHNSIRRFGSVKLHTKESLQTALSKLGPEPLDKNFTTAKFVTLISSFPNANIKNKLLDQHCVVGIGNIYAQEALYHASIHPEKTIKEISTKKLASLHREVKRILNIAIKNNGTTVDNYSHLDGKGDFQNLLAVYNQTKCPKKHLLKKIKQSGRSTSYCPKCQN